MILVWHDTPLLEQQWLRDMLHGLVETEIFDPELQYFGDNSIHVISSNVRALPLYEKYFAECRSCCRKLVLFHASDEFFSGGYRLYRHFDYVIRNFYTYLTTEKGILHIPEGYPNATRLSNNLRPTNERQYMWSFVGEIKASRIDMVKTLSHIEPNFLKKTASISDPNKKWLSKEDYDDIMDNTVFSPCPMGNVILETWRFYESLERGCIPLAEKRWGLDYFTNLLGPHPVPTFLNWKSARAYAEHLTKNPVQLQDKQVEIYNWWNLKKASVRTQIHDAVTGRSYSPELIKYASSARNRSSSIHDPLRIIELSRHQTAYSLFLKLRRPIGPLKRMFRDASSRTV